MCQTLKNIFLKNNFFKEKYFMSKQMEHKSLCKNLSSYSILKLVANKFLNNFKTIHWIGRKSLIKQFKPTCRVRIGQKIHLICFSIYIV
jgi:hypothetical protein